MFQHPAISRHVITSVNDLYLQLLQIPGAANYRQIRTFITALVTDFMTILAALFIKQDQPFAQDGVRQVRLRIERLGFKDGRLVGLEPCPEQADHKNDHAYSPKNCPGPA